MLQIQKFHLEKTTDKKVYILKNSNESIISGAINLMELNTALSTLAQIKIDLFISMWSLSEANRDTQLKVERVSFFRAKEIYHFFHTKKNIDIPNTSSIKFKKYHLTYSEKLERFNSGYSTINIYSRIEN